MKQTLKKTKNSSDMPLKTTTAKSELLKPRITIFGVGGAGGNAINNMIRSNLEGVEFIAANTDAQALSNSLASNLIQLGVNTTKGLGAGSFPDRGRAAAEENIEEIEKYIEGSNMVFIAAGMGGGTGTGAAPVIAKLARERDMLTVGVVTKPFHFEGKYRMETAESGIEELKKYVDTLIIIPNQNLFRIANENTTFESAFKMADDVLHAGVRGVTDLITMPGLVNLDFADIRTIMTKMGKAMMGTGEAEGTNRAIAACEAAISNPLLDDISIKGAKGVLVNMTGGPDMTLFEADLAVNTIRKEVDPNANIIFGSAFNENMKGKIRISVVATGIDVDDFKKDNSESYPPIKEPARFNLTSLEPALSDKTFFDTGSIANPEKDKIVEISETDLKPKQEFLKEPNPKYGNQLDIETEEKENLEIEDFLTEDEKKEESFFEDIETEETEMINLKDLEKPKKPAKKSKKENSGGFSLFSFMNSSKNKDDFNFEDENEAEDIITKPKLNKQQNSFLSKEKLGQAAKKHQEFFGEEDQDEDEISSDKNEKIEDDILNVPAFFRRRVDK
jgi:cell division protein FtsZ